MPHIPEHLLGDAFSKAPFDLSPGRAKVKRTLKSAGPQAPPPGAIPTNRPNIFQRAGGAISSAFSSLDETLRKPETGKFLSQLGAAINPRSNVSAGLGILGTSIAEQRSETEFRSRVAAGEDPNTITGGLTGALSSEQRSSLIGEALRGKSFGLEERRVASGESRAQTEAARFARGEFINISGTGKIFNTATGEITDSGVRPGAAGASSANVRSAQNADFKTLDDMRAAGDKAIVDAGFGEFVTIDGKQTLRIKDPELAAAERVKAHNKFLSKSLRAGLITQQTFDAFFEGAEEPARPVSAQPVSTPPGVPTPNINAPVNTPLTDIFGGGPQTPSSPLDFSIPDLNIRNLGAAFTNPPSESTLPSGASAPSGSGFQVIQDESGANIYIAPNGKRYRLVGQNRIEEILR